MAVQGILMPFHVQTKIAVSWPKLTIPTFIFCQGKANRLSRLRFFCSQSEICMSKYREMFARRMTMVGLKPFHRIAMAVSGGPDSIALCLLAAGWKSDNFDAGPKERSSSVDGLLAIVVDHGLRPESPDEANVVYKRISDMGIKCEVVRCEWLNGRPKAGHLQEAARIKRYETLQNVCIKQQINILLVAHHADDQAELFVLRLSRNSGVFGLAGMAFVSQMFHEFPDFGEEGSHAPGILLVRPLLEFSKQDMYNICRVSNQQWVEDPTNRSTMYARNRIRMSLSSLSSSIFKAELQAVISACQQTRLYVDKVCRHLFTQTVTITPHGYAVIDLGKLNSKEVKDIILTKFIALVLQFISQRHRPVRGSASKLLLSYLRTYPCKSCLTVAGCYLCPAPRSKGTKVLVCCFVDTPFPLMVKIISSFSYSEQKCGATRDLEQIITDSEACMNRYVPDASSVLFLDVTSSDSLLDEAKRTGIISDSTCRCIESLQKEESEKFVSKPENTSDFVSKDDSRSSGATLSKLICPGQVGYLMDRFVLDWKEVDASDDFECVCSSCKNEMAAEVRYMIDAHWIYLSELSNFGARRLENDPCVESHQLSSKTMDYAVESACKALVSLNSIPAAARRALPVLVNAEGVVLSIPSIGFSCCSHMKKVHVVYQPRIPFGGGHSSFL